MKNVIVKNFTHAEVADPTASFGFLKIPAKNDLIRAEGENLEVSDGYHTFDELYDHRVTLFIALCEVLMAGGFYKNPVVWRSKLHADGSSYDGWFIMGINKESGKQMSYHLPMSEWGRTEFAETLENAPEWDGHTPADVLGRLRKL